MKILAIIAGIVVVGGGVYFISTSHKGAASDTSSADTSSAAMQESTSANEQAEYPIASAAPSNSPEELAKKGGQFSCTFDVKSSQADSSGIVYIDGKKFRGDFTSTVKAVSMTIVSHTVSDGSYAYSWTSSSPIGFKAAITASSDPYSSMTGTMSGSASVNGANTAWQCQAATFGADKFAVPTDITFQGAPAKN